MANTIQKPHLVISPIREKPATKKATIPSSEKDQFQKILDTEFKKAQSVRFSAHATRRLESRNIQFTSKEQAQLARAVDRAANKGARDSLILLNNLALVVNVKNRTVITAMDAEQMQEGVFTNIDSAFIVHRGNND